MQNITSFTRVSEMNNAYGNPKGNPHAINVPKLRSQTRNILDEYCELQIALGADPEAVAKIKALGKDLKYVTDTIDLKDTRDALCDIHVFAYGAHHLMGIDANVDMTAVVDGVMTRFIKDEVDKAATIALHAAKGVTDVYFEGEFPKMIMKSASDQPDAPKGKFLKSMSYKDTVFNSLTTEKTVCIDVAKHSANLMGTMSLAMRMDPDRIVFIGSDASCEQMAKKAGFTLLVLPAGSAVPERMSSESMIVL